MSRSENRAILSRVASEEGISDEMLSYLMNIMDRESGGNARARNPNSSARGLFQFIDSTWDRYGNGADVYDPEAQCRAVIAFARDNAEVLRSTLGREPTAGEYYLAHFAGPAGARDILQADPNTPIAEILSAGAINANASIRLRTGTGMKRFEDFTARDIRNWANGLMHGSSYRNARDEGNIEEANRYAREFLHDTEFSDGEIDQFFNELGGFLNSLIEALFSMMLPPEEEIPGLDVSRGDSVPVQTVPYIPPTRADGPTILNT